MRNLFVSNRHSVRVVDLVALLLGLCQAPAVDAPWRATEQPELKQAPVLQTESLGEPARWVNVWERWMVPNRDGKSCEREVSPNRCDLFARPFGHDFEQAERRVEDNDYHAFR